MAFLTHNDEDNSTTMQELNNDEISTLIKEHEDREKAAEAEAAAAAAIAATAAANR